MVNMDKSPKSNKLFETTDFDNAICLTGYGKFHYEVIAACAVCILSVGFQNGLSSYVFPAAQCELDLTSYDIGLLNVWFLVGGTISSFLWGILADLCGRRKVLMLTHFINAFITIICATNPYKITLLVCRFFNGFLIGAPGSLIFSYLAEFQPPKYRSASVCYCGLFFTSAWLLLPISAYLVLPIDVSIHIHKFFVLTPWRFLFILLILPEIVAGLWFMRLPESPKYYMSQGEHEEVLCILRRMYEENTGKDGYKFPVKRLISEAGANIHREISCDGQFSRMMKGVLSQIKSLFQPPLLVLTMLTCSIMFSNMFGVFGLGLWLPELFIRFEQYQELHPNASVTVKELSGMTKMNNQTCEPSFDGSVIQNTVAMALSSLLFNAVSGWFSTRTNPKTIPLISMLLGGLSSLSIFWMTSSMQNLIVSCIFQASMVTANMTIGSVGVELFPTKVGGIAICLIMCAGRIGAMCSNLVFGYLMDDHCEIPIFVVAVVVLTGAFLCLLIPNRNNNENQTDEYMCSSKPIEVSVIANGLK